MEDEKSLTCEHEPGHDLQLQHEDPTIRFLHRIIRIAVKVLAVLMVLVIVTALMAIARKVIIFDYENITPDFVYATAAVVLALGLTYWLIARKV